MRNMNTTSMLAGNTTTGAGDTIRGVARVHTFQASGSTSAGVGASVIVVQGRNGSTLSWDTIGTITLTLGTTVTGDSFTSDDRYAEHRMYINSISGTDAAISGSRGD